jgi:CheY-like chemotaxis protein
MDSIPASPRVLVVDDDPDVLASLERGLRLSGFEVFTAVDGAEALRSATETRPDAIVLDINMPVLDGVSVVTALRAMDNDVPVCVLTREVVKSYLEPQHVRSCALDIHLGHACAHSVDARMRARSAGLL